MPFIYKVANETEKLGALALRNAIYAQEREYVPGDSLDAVAYQLVACTPEREVVACFRMVTQENRPFDLESFVSLEEILASDSVPAEVGRLCVRTDYRYVAKGHFLHYGLFKISCLLAAKLGVTDFVMYTFGSLVRFYRGVHFIETGKRFFHPGYHETMHVMRLNFRSLANEGSKPRSRLFRNLLSPDPNRFQI